MPVHKVGLSGTCDVLDKNLVKSVTGVWSGYISSLK